MVSSGTVSSDSSSFVSNIGSYQSAFESLSSSWTGPSYEGLSSKVEEFINEYKSTVEKQMAAFAAACASYEQYIQEKNAYNTAIANYNAAVSNNDPNAGAYQAEASQHKQRMDQLREEINAKLGEASSPTLTATAIGGDQTSSGNLQLLSSLSGGSAVETAISTALQIAGDDTHGYSQKTRWGNPNYDCSSFVITCWDSAGTGVKDAGATYTGNMRKAFLKTGLFEWIPMSKVTEYQVGDVLLSENSHTEMYIGDGKMVGAHGDKDGRNGDGSGSEISVVKARRGWDGVLRYIGPGEPTLSI